MTDEDFHALSPEDQVALLKKLYRWDSDDVSLFDRQCPGHMREDFYRHDKCILSLLDPKSHEVGLNVGCGCGRVEAQWAGRVRELHGVDFSAAAIDVARREVSHPNVAFYRNDGRTLPPYFEQGAFDFAWCEQVFQHVPRDITCGYLKEIARVLKPGGRFVAQFPNVLKYGNSWDMGGMTRENVDAALADAGFSSWEMLPSDGLPGEGVVPSDEDGVLFYFVPRCIR